MRAASVRTTVGYRREGGYGNREGGYRDNNGGGFRRPQGGYGNNRFGGGRPQQRRTGNYDPNAKYSMKKQIEYKELNVDPGCSDSFEQVLGQCRSLFPS